MVIANSYFLIKIHVVGTQKNHLNEMERQNEGQAELCFAKVGMGGEGEVKQLLVTRID